MLPHQSRGSERKSSLRRIPRPAWTALFPLSRGSMVSVVLGVALSGRGGFFRGCGAALLGSGRRGLTARLTAFVRGRMSGGLALARSAGPLAATVVFVHRGPRPSFGLFFGDAAFLVAFGDVIGFAILFVGVFRFIAAWHADLLSNGEP